MMENLTIRPLDSTHVSIDYGNLNVYVKYDPWSDTTLVRRAYTNEEYIIASGNALQSGLVAIAGQCTIKYPTLK